MSNDVKMETDSDWVDLGSASATSDTSNIEFTAKLQSVGGGGRIALFSKEPRSNNDGAASDEYLLTLEGKARVEQLPWLQQVGKNIRQFIFHFLINGRK